MPKKAQKPTHIDQQNAGPMLTTKQYDKIKKLEKESKSNDRKDV
jgi:hypothetical protein